MKMSIKKIAELAEVSKTTVSFVLNGRGDEKNISVNTQEKIIEIAKIHNYEANYIARSLSIGKSYTLGFVVPDISNPFYGKIAQFVQQYAEEKGYSVMVASTGEDIEKEKKIISQFVARQVDGAILASCTPNYDKLSSVINKNLPTILFDRIFKEVTDSYVDIDNEQSTYKITEAIINKGHKRIAIISLTSYLPNISQRISGYKMALEDHGISFDEELFYEVNYMQKKESTKEAFEQLFTLKNAPTAFLFLNNVLAAEGIWTINTYYPHLTNNLLFASFDNLDLFDYSRPKVISALQPNNEIAKNCVDMLCSQIENSELTAGIQLNTTIINR